MKKQYLNSFCSAPIDQGAGAAVTADAMAKVRLTKALPEPGETSQLNVHRFRGLVTHEEISDILQFEQDNRFRLGSTRRDNVGIRKINSEWITTYLHTDLRFQQRFPALVQKLVRAALEADRRENWGLIRPVCSSNSLDTDAMSELEQERMRHLGVRVIELHRVSPGGGLCDLRHRDTGSVMTVDVMLADSGEDFTGGHFCTVTHPADGDDSSAAVVQKHEFAQGDVMVFPSHKYHFVQPVKSGLRIVLVMELWYGQDRSCAHRCLTPSYEPCTFSLSESVAENILKAALPDVDPW
jgi:hypothetical protein